MIDRLALRLAGLVASAMQHRHLWDELRLLNKCGVVLILGEIELLVRDRHGLSTCLHLNHLTICKNNFGFWLTATAMALWESSIDDQDVNSNCEGNQKANT